MSIELENLGSGFSTGIINNNFQLLEDYINNNLLNRDGIESGEANQMELPLDMNSHPVLNASVDPDDPGSLLTVEAADSRYVNVTGDSMSGPLDMGGNDISGVGTTRTKSLIVGGIPVKPPTDLEVPYVIYVDTIADLQALDTSALVGGQQVQVKEYHTGTGVGGGEFYWDPSSEEEGNLGTVLAIPGLAVGRFKRILVNNQTTSAQWGLPGGSLSPANRAERVQKMWDWCAASGVKAVMLPGTYTVDRYSGSPYDSGCVNFTENLVVHFENGVKFQNVDFLEEDNPYTKRCITASSSSRNIIATGRLEIDGKGDTVTWYREHNHCIFFYGCKDIDMSGLHIVAYNSMGDCVSLSGRHNVDDITERVKIGSITCLKLNSSGRTARRKSLVIESCADCWIGRAVLDNGSANCLDYEPLSVSNDGETMSLKIDYLKCFSGTDYTAGVSLGRQRVAKLYIDTFVISLPDREAALKAGGRLIYSFGVDCVVNSLSIDYRNSESSSSGAMFLRFPGCRWSVDDLHIVVSDYVYGANAVFVEAATSQGESGPAELNVGNLRLKGRGNKTIIAKGIVTGRSFIIEGTLAEDGTKYDLGSTSIGGQWNQHLSHYLSVGSVLFKNVRNLSGGLISPSFYQQRYPMLWKIGQVTVIDESIDEPINSVVLCGPAHYQEHVHIGGIALKGQKPLSLATLRPGGASFWVSRGGFGYPSEYFRDGNSPAVISALAGSTCRCKNGTYWIKTADDDGAGDGTFGWQQLATVNA